MIRNFGWPLQMWRDNKLLLQLFEPEELEALVCGGTDLDFSALQRAAKYEDGFDANSQVWILSLRLSRRVDFCATAYLLSTVFDLMLHIKFVLLCHPWQHDVLVGMVSRAAFSDCLVPLPQFGAAEAILCEEGFSTVCR